MTLEIKNGIGWNNHAALRGTKLARLLCVKRLAKRADVDRLVIESSDACAVSVLFYRGGRCFRAEDLPYYVSTETLAGHVRSLLTHLSRLTPAQTQRSFPRLPRP